MQLKNELNKKCDSHGWLWPTYNQFKQWMQIRHIFVKLSLQMALADGLSSFQSDLRWNLRCPNECEQKKFRIQKAYVEQLKDFLL